MDIRGKKLYRKDSSMLFGVCSGVAEYFGIDPNAVRLVWAILSVATFSTAFWIYVAAAFLLPKQSECM